MRLFLGLVAIALVSAALVAASARAVPAKTAGGPAGRAAAVKYSRAVTRICAGAVLFEHAHEMGTRADALEVASDIRASTARRLALVVAVPVPRRLRPISRRWIASQRRLAAIFARSWVQIYDAIDAAQTPEQIAALPRRLHRFVHAPDRLRLAAGRLELKLHVPDCTGD